MEVENIIADISFSPEPTRSNYVSYVGRKYARLTVVGYAGKVGANRKWWCRCECGNVTKVQSSDIRIGKVRSCGCLNSEVTTARNTRHGLSKTPEYAVWIAMRDRCKNSQNKQYKDYGGRGITVCDEWDASFERFLSDVGPRLSKDMTIERRDTNAGYEKANCYWPTRTTQANNKRNNHLLTAKGMTMSMAEWARIVPTPYSTIRSRKRLGYTDHQALYGIDA